MAKTTVVIINWNGDRYLPALLDRLKQENCEIIAVDNGSTDNSRELCNLKLNHNWGFSLGNNIAAATVTTENILFMNNDMLPAPGFLARMEEPDYPIVGAKLIFGEDKELNLPDKSIFKTTRGKVQHAGIGINNSYLPYEIWRNSNPDDPEVNQARIVSGVTGACLLIKTKIFCELRGFNTSFINGWEDVDLCWRAREKGYNSWYEPTAEVLHYCSSSVGRFDYEKQNRDYFIQTWPKERVQKLNP